jgi:hypothetical protein
MITDAEIEDFLAHHGVRGMKWGVRRGRSVTGISRTRGAALDRNKRLIRQHTQARDRTGGKLLRAATAPDIMLLGRTRFESLHTMHISNLKAQNARIKSGQVTLRDKMQLAMTTPLASLVVQRRPGP